MESSIAGSRSWNRSRVCMFGIALVCGRAQQDAWLRYYYHRINTSFMIVFSNYSERRRPKVDTGKGSVA
jgi:hypothetical protein